MVACLIVYRQNGKKPFRALERRKTPFHTLQPASQSASALLANAPAVGPSLPSRLPLKRHKNTLPIKTAGEEELLSKPHSSSILMCEYYIPSPQTDRQNIPNPKIRQPSWGCLPWIWARKMLQIPELRRQRRLEGRFKPIEISMSE